MTRTRDAMTLRFEPINKVSNSAFFFKLIPLLISRSDYIIFALYEVIKASDNEAIIEITINESI